MQISLMVRDFPASKWYQTYSRLRAFPLNKDSSRRNETMATGADDGGTEIFGLGALGAGIGPMPASWDLEADVVIIGAGATGLPAAIKAADEGASVIVVEANYDVGGHAILSGGNIPLGGGTSAQRKYGIADSPDTVFADLTDWTIVQPNGWPDYRYNDRAIMRAFADHCAATYEFLVANGVEFKEVPPDNVGAHSTGNSAPRENHAFWTDGSGLGSPSGRGGAGLVRPLEASARAKGVKFLLHYRMTRLVRTASAEGHPGRVVGLTATYAPRILPGATTPLQSYRANGNLDMTQPRVSIRATKAVILATGGSTSNVHFRRMFDPRLTEVYQVAGEPYSFQRIPIGCLKQPEILASYRQHRPVTVCLGRISIRNIAGRRIHCRRLYHTKVEY
jgi:hypothetical protein